MVIELAIAVFIPLSFWLFDMMVKVLGAISIEDVGSDLCLFGVSFNTTTLLISTISSILTVQADNVRADPAQRLVSQDTAQYLVACSASALIISLILYVFCLIIIAPGTGRTYPSWFTSLRSRPDKINLTVIIGFLALSMEIGVYLLLLNKKF